MSRPTIALAMIVKNEAHNLGPLLQSISGCFDHIYMTDTGSTDNTVEILKSAKAAEIAGCPITVSHFDWVENFAKARQHSFNQVDKKYDYTMWMDGDDTMGDKDAFIHFRDHTMHCAHMWLATYNYAFDNSSETKRPVCSFLRERIIKNNHGFSWKFFLHEGIVQEEKRPYKAQAIYTWTVDHKRTADDMKKDNGRNLRLFEINKLKEELCPRMMYYYGKELFDSGRYLDSIEQLHLCIEKHGVTLEPHDRIMALQYLASAYAECEKWELSLKAALNGIQLCPDRAEYWIIAADSNVRMGRVAQSAIFYEAAKRCSPVAAGGLTFTSPDARITYPALQLAKIHQQTGNTAGIRAEAELLKTINHPEAANLMAMAENIEKLSAGPVIADLLQTEDIVITCPPGGATSDWDENTLRTQGTGGSETACIEVARLLKEKTGRSVKVFQTRKSTDRMPSGVEYMPVSKIQDYLFKYKPRVHIAWRHSTPITPAPTFVWSHDLVTPGGDQVNKYEKYLCLSGFHKEFTKDMLRVTDDKISVINNGIDTSLFKHRKLVTKNPNKIIFTSSPDRGMERCIEIVKRVRKEVPDAELHLFYGFKNMRLSGMNEESDKLEAMIRDNSDFVKFHGFVNKETLVGHWLDSAVWLYPADFIETNCISAMESMAAGTWPVVRRMGALPWTLSEAIEKEMCDILDVDASCEEEYQQWADVVSSALKEKKWERMDIDPENYSWSKATDQIMQVTGLM